MRECGGEYLRTRKLGALTERQSVCIVHRGGEDELEHNNTTNSKELILHQASMEAMYCIDLQMRVCGFLWKGSAAERAAVRYFYDVGHFLF